MGPSSPLTHICSGQVGARNQQDALTQTHSQTSKVGTLNAKDAAFCYYLKTSYLGNFDEGKGQQSLALDCEHDTIKGVVLQAQSYASNAFITNNVLSFPPRGLEYLFQQNMMWQYDKKEYDQNGREETCCTYYTDFVADVNFIIRLSLQTKIHTTSEQP
jgi:hypothetical protein